MGIKFSTTVNCGDPAILSRTQLFNILCDFRCFVTIFDCRTVEEYAEYNIDTSIHISDDTNNIFNKNVGDSTELQQELQKLNAIVCCGNNALQTDNFCNKIMKLKIRFALKDLQVYTLEGTVDAFREDYPYLCTDFPCYQQGMLYPSNIANRVFLSNLGVATNCDVLHNLGITHVVNCTVDCPYADEISREVSIPALDDSCAEASTPSITRSVNINYRLRVPVVDDSDANIFSHFEEASRFIQSALADEQSRILIHCKHGQSRSATIAAAWLIAFHGHSPGSAIKHLKACRPRVSPNAGFIHQLELWQQNFEHQERDT